MDRSIQTAQGEHTKAGTIYLLGSHSLLETHSDRNVPRIRASFFRWSVQRVHNNLMNSAFDIFVIVNIVKEKPAKIWIKISIHKEKVFKILLKYSVF
jgi:hypothetical protein